MYFLVPTNSGVAGARNVKKSLTGFSASGEWSDIFAEESRSADCGRDEGGKFGPKNDCASGDGYRGGHKAPRSDGYSKSADDVTGSWPDDIYSKDAGRLYGHGDPSIDNESAKIIKSLKGKPDETVRIYRAVPSNVDDMINPGDWVSINETYAKQHGESTLGGDYKVVSMTVPARHIFTDGNSIHEWGYDPRPKKKELRSDCEKDEGGRFAKGNDCASGDGPSSQPRAWGRDTEKWGGSSETEIWTPDKPLFSGSEKLASVTIERPNMVRDFVGDSLKMSISDVALASGAVIESPERANITQPRLTVRLDENTNQLTAFWSTKGVATGEGYAPEEKQYAPKPGTVVSATEAVRRLSLKSDGVELRMDSFFVHPDFQGKGLAVESVSRSMSTPVTKMTMTAARGDSPMPDHRMTGYKVWPKFGYDAPISKVLKSAGTALPKEFSKAKTILDLFEMPGGPEWWADVGSDIELTFDNRPRSRSRDIMLQLKDKKRKRSIDVSKQNQIGTDSDYDESLDELWAEIQKKGLSGQSPSEEDWERWEKERTDGSSGEVRSH